MVAIGSLPFFLPTFSLLEFRFPLIIKEEPICIHRLLYQYFALFFLCLVPITREQVFNFN